MLLARFLDDSTFNLIASLIYSNHLEIFNYIKDSEILEHLFSIYDNCNDEKTNAIVLMMMMTMMMIISK